MAGCRCPITYISVSPYIVVKQTVLLTGQCPYHDDNHDMSADRRSLFFSLRLMMFDLEFHHHHLRGYDREN